MAVSVRIEDEAFSDARIAALGELAGYNAYEALGRMSHLWRLCTQRRLYVVSEVMVRACLGSNGVEAIVGAELGERTEAGIRICGTQGRIEWLDEARNTAKAGGQARASTAIRGPDGKMLSNQNGDLTHFNPANASDSQPAGPATPAVSSVPAPAPVPSPALKQEQSIAPDGARSVALVPTDSRQLDPETEHHGPSQRADVLAVFEHYRRHHPRSHPKPRSTGVEWRKIRARLDEGYSVADLCSAIDGYHRSPFHLGENERGTKYLDLELITRDGSNIAKGIEWSTAPPTPMTRKGLEVKRALDSFDPEMFTIRDAEGNRL